MISEQFFWIAISANAAVCVLFVWIVVLWRLGRREWWVKVLRILLVITFTPAIVVLGVLLLRYFVGGEGTLIKPPVRFEPPRIIATQDGAHILKAINQGEAAIVLYLGYDVDSNRASARGQDKTYLLAEGQDEVEVNVSLYGHEPATVTPTIERWERAMRAPLSMKAPMPKIMKRERTGPDSEKVWLDAHREVICFYVNGSDRTIQVFPEARLEPEVWWAQVRVGNSLQSIDYQIAAYKVKPGEACWFHVYVLPWLGMGKSHDLDVSPTLTISIQETAPKPNDE